MCIFRVIFSSFSANDANYVEEEIFAYTKTKVYIFISKQLDLLKDKNASIDIYSKANWEVNKQLTNRIDNIIVQRKEGLLQKNIVWITLGLYNNQICDCDGDCDYNPYCSNTQMISWLWDHGVWYSNWL